MSDKSSIEWTEATWNVITGCSVESAGCKNCYAMKLAGTRLQHHPSRAGLTQDTAAGPVWTGEVRFNEQWLSQPLEWKRPRRIFVCAHADLFHPNVPDEWIDKVFAVMAMAPHHTFQVLTKRAERMRDYLSRAEISIRDEVKYEPAAETMTWPLPNVWVGVSVEDQDAADKRIPSLLATPAAVRWISAEPLLGPVDLYRFMVGDGHDAPYFADGGLHWVVVGGESGPKARPMHPAWARSLRDQCAAAGVPFLFKQWGEWAPDFEGAMTCTGCGATKFDAAVNTRHRNAAGEDECGHCGGSQWNDAEKPLGMARVGKKAAGRHLDGNLHDGYPGYCGKISNGIACRMPAGHKCPDCGLALHDFPEGS